MKIRDIMRSMDHPLNIALCALMVISLMVISSATGVFRGNDLSYVIKQASWIVVGICAFFLATLVNYEIFSRFFRIIYILNIGLLLAVLKYGSSALGAQRWIQIGPLPFQPSEFAKISIIITLATLLSKREDVIKTYADMVPYFVHVGIPMLLIFKQPDLGTSLVMIAVLLGMLYICGAPSSKLLALVATGLVCVVLVLFLHLQYGLPLPFKDYQINRLIVFLDPDVDPLGLGYQLRQSMIAIGSGKIWGKGLFRGSQNQLRFLPERHTDFIFSVIGEELGFIKASAILGIYLFILARSLLMASHVRDRLGALITVGVISMLVFHVVVNVGMTVGMMPVTGLPLPFMSYGGNSLLTNCVSMGILQGIYARQRKGIF